MSTSGDGKRGICTPCIDYQSLGLLPLRLGRNASTVSMVYHSCAGIKHYITYNIPFNSHISTERLDAFFV